MKAQITHTRRNPNAKSFQEVFYPESMIQRTNRLQRLVRNLSFPVEGSIYVGDISEFCNEDLGLIFHRTKYKSSLSGLVFDPSTFDFPYISWSPVTSEPLGEYFQHLPNPEFPPPIAA